MSSARANLQKGIIDTKEACKKRIEDHTTHNDLQRMWQGVQHINNKGSTEGTVEAYARLAEDFNHFFAQFEFNEPKTDSLPTFAFNTIDQAKL